MRKYAQYILNTLLLVLVTGGMISAQEFSFLPDRYVNPYYSKNIKLSGSPSSYGDVLGTTSADEWSYMTANSGSWTQKYQFKSVSNYLKVAINQESKDVVSNYKYQLTFQVKGYSDPANPGTYTTQNHSLVLEYNKDSLSRYKDAVLLKLPGTGFFSMNVTLLDIQDISGGTPSTVNRSALASNFFIQAEVVTQRYDQEESHKQVYINSEYHSASQELEVRWGHYFTTDIPYFPPGYLPPYDHFKPAKYELEWTYVDDYQLNNYNHTTGSMGYLNSASSFSIPYNFKNNASRIQTDNNYFRIPVVYGHGAVIFRIRKIRPDASNYNTAVYYDWNLPESGVLDNSSFSTSAFYSNPYRNPSNCLYVIESPHQSDSINWQYSISYAEEGKYKHVLNYFDGMGKNRQTQTKINSDPNYIVGVDNIYDFEGRPAITTLPTPVQSSNLQYKPNLSLHAGTGLPYTAADFDTGCVTDTLTPFAGTALASVYYSAQNPDQSGLQKFVPDAGGYPFIQTIYSPDYTDKVLWQGGAGPAFQRGKGHGTRYAYVRAGQKELNRLFGTESGYFQYYPKQVTMDPNGQASFAIMDPSGKTIATALAGTAPSSLLYPIDSLSNLAPASYTVQDILYGNPQTIDKYTRNAEYSYYNEAVGYNGLRYGVDIAPFPTGCSGQYINVAGTYTYKIIDECGGVYLSKSGTAGIDSITGSSQHQHYSGSKDSLELMPAKYTIIKELRFSDSTISSMASTFVDQHTGPGQCYTGKEVFVRDEVEQASFPCVQGDTLNPCDALRQRLKSELYPGAKYGLYIPDAQGNFAAGVGNSIFTYYSLYDSMVTGWVSTTTPVSGDKCKYTVRTEYWDHVPDPNADPYTLQWNDENSGTWTSHYFDETTEYDYPLVLPTNPTGAHATKYFITAGPTQCRTRDTTYPNATNIGKCLYQGTYIGNCTVPGGGGSPVNLMTTIEVWGTSSSALPSATTITQSVYYNYQWHQFSCPATLDMASIQVLECVENNPYYRYQSECLDSFNLAITSTDAYGQTSTVTVPMEQATPQQLIAGFNDDVAEALLPLHPEYCKLLACDTGNFEARLSQIETYDQAVALGMHTLSGITAQDPLCVANKPAAPYSVDQLSYFEADAQLSTANAALLQRFDSMAVAQAYCGCNASEATIYCREQQYRYQINNMILADKPIKDLYIQSLKSLYLANRGMLKQRLTDGAGDACGPCDALRMNMVGQANFTTIFDANGDVINESIPQDIRDLINDRMHNTTDTSRPALVTGQVNADSKNFCQNQISMILDDLKQCGNLTSSDLSTLATYLDSYCTGTSMGENITPAIIRDKLVAMGKYDEICQPFLAKYGIFDKQMLTEKGSHISKSPAFYQDLNSFMNRYEITVALMESQTTGSSSYSISLNQSNAFEKELLQQFGLSSGSNISVQGFKQSYPISAGNTQQTEVYKLVLATGGQSDTLFLAGRNLRGNEQQTPLKEVDPLGATLTTNIAFVNTHSILRDSLVYGLAEGGIADKLAYLSLNKSVYHHGLGTTRNTQTLYNLWAHRLPMLVPRAAEGVEECVNCELLRRTVDSYYTNATYYNLPVNAAHPFFSQSLQNYLNYKLKKKHGIEEYEALMSGCALSDKIAMSASPATVQSVFTTASNTDFSAAQSFVQTLQQTYPDSRIEHFMFKNLADNTVTIWFDLRHIHEAQKVKSIRDYILANTPGGGAQYLPSGHLAEVFRTGGATYSISGASISSQNVRIPHQDGSYSDAVRYMVDASGTTAADKSGVIQSVRAFAATDAGAAYSKIVWGMQFYRSSDYSSTDKQAYLGYVYGLSSLQDHEVAAALAPATLQQQISAFSSTDLALSYNSPWCTDSKRNLYYWSKSQGSHTGFQRLNTVLGQVKTNLGSNKLFPTTASVTISGSTGTNNASVKAFRQGNGGAWYRIFDTDNKLYNIYLTPSDKMVAPPQEYGMVSVSPSLYTAEGATEVYRFNVRMARGADTVTVYGYTDFPIAVGSKLQNVVLQDNYGQKRQCIDTNTCERSGLLAAIEQGEQLHYAYIDSLKRSLKAAMAWHFPQQAVDTLYHSMQSQQYHYTLYYYDLAGNLTRTVPPQGVQPLSAANAAGVDAARSSASASTFMSLKASHNKRSEYRYNSYNQLVWQQTPDGGITEFFYDKAGRLVFSQNAVQRAANRYSYTLYDDQSRPCETGQIPGDVNPVPGTHPDYVGNSSGKEMNGTGGIADWVKTKTREEVVATRYDEALIALNGYDNMLSPQENLRKRVSVILYSPAVTTQMSIDSYYHYATHFSYDAMGNVKTLTHDNPYLDYLKQRFKRIDYDYDLLSGKVNMLSYNRGWADQYYQRYEYDADNRLVATFSSKDGIDWDRDAAYAYYKHGPLAEVQYGDLNVQGVQYAYTIQGWLKAINGDVLYAAEDMGHNGYADSTYPSDVMAHSLDYYAGDYSPIGSQAVSHLADPTRSLYNGNIVRQATATTGSSNMVREYSYDQLHRIKQTQYSLYDNVSHAVTSMVDAYKNTYSYDPDGNIQTLTRNNGASTQIDNFIYHYSNAAQNNKLDYVQDQAANTGGNDLKNNQTAGNYSYDAIGNLKSDQSEGIKEIRWNTYGKMLSLSKGTVQDDTMQMQFSYDGMGNRIRKDYWQNLGSSSTGATRMSDIYVRDAQGNILAVYKEKALINGTNTIDWLNDQLMSNVSQLAISNFLLERVGSSGPFVNELMNDAVVNHSSWSFSLFNSQPAEYYMSHNEPMYGLALQTYLSPSYGDIVSTDWHLVADAFMGNPEKINRSGRLMEQLVSSDYDGEARTQVLLHLVSASTALGDDLLGHMGVNPEGLSEWDKAMAMQNFIGDNGPGAFASLFTERAGDYDTRDFWEAALKDPVVLRQDLLDNYRPVTDALTEGLADRVDGNNSDLISYLAGWMDANDPGAFLGQFSPESKLNVVYEADKSLFLQDYLGTHGIAGVSHSIQQIPGVTAISYNSWITGAAQIGLLPMTVMQFVNTPSPQNIDADTLYLAEHHLYGSKRLGIKYYEPEQYRNIYVPGSPVVQGTSAKVPWYSMAYEEMVKKGIREPQTIGDRLVDTLRSTRNLGTKEYELSDHLGNVLANILDRKTGYGGNSSLYQGFRADVSNTTDYYPFGFQMSERSLGGSGRFGFNGKERDNEISGFGNSYDFGARMYNSQIGKFLSIDPRATEFAWQSTYAYAYNNPIYILDIEGEGGDLYIKHFQYSNNTLKSIQYDDIVYKQSGTSNRAFVRDPNATSKTPNRMYHKGYYYIQVMIPSSVYDVSAFRFGLFSRSQFDIDRYDYIHSKYTDQTPRERLDEDVWESDDGIVEVALIMAGLGASGKSIKYGASIGRTQKWVGHIVPWRSMTKIERRAFQHSYSRHFEELGLPKWKESAVESLQTQFNQRVSEIRDAGRNSFFNSMELVNGVRTQVRRTEPVINGERYYYYETKQGKFISAGRLP